MQPNWHMLVDLRHINCSKVVWKTESGEAIPLNNPSSPKFEAHATVHGFPHGVRLVALTAERLGEFTTVAMVPEGRRLRLNARVRRAGEIRVGINGLPGYSAERCLPLNGDGNDLVVSWREGASVPLPDGRPVTLTFHMRAA